MLYEMRIYQRKLNAARLYDEVEAEETATGRTI